MTTFLSTPIAKHLMAWLGCVHITCGPLGFLQVIAWASMLASYSLEDGLARGVVDTFSGDRPCAMCVKIAESAPAHDRKPEAPNPERHATGNGLSQSWQIPSTLHLDPPPARDIARGCGHSGIDENMTSTLRPGPETPPPRMVHDRV